MKGQISIEFLTILSVFLIVFIGISVGLMKLATSNMKEVYEKGVWKSDKIVLEEATNYVRFTNGGKLVYLRVPVDCNMSVMGGNRINIYCTTFNGSYYSTYARFVPKGTIRSGDYIPVQVAPL
jgi:hypothetical protein